MARLAVRVQPRSKREGIESVCEGVVIIRVSAPPVDNKANETVRKLIARGLRIPRSTVTLVKGSKSRDKVFAVSGLTSGEALDRLKACI